MSFQYDQYLANHRANVKRGYDWLCEYLPDVINECTNAGWQTLFAHDQSKNEIDEYEAYDAYFYGNNRSYAVVQNYNRAWLLHIHRNPHHWQHWVLINDDPKEGELVLEMPYDYIIEMICDWWSFSWKNGDLKEIFSWYDEHSKYMKLASKTHETVEKILGLIKTKVEELDDQVNNDILFHHGVKGQKWGVKNGPPYPIRQNQKVAKVVKHDNSLKNAAGKDIITVKHVELSGTPNSITQIKRKNGGIDRNYYDNLGRQSKQISNNDHGQPVQHPYGEHGEHAHDYIYDNDGKLTGRPVRELTLVERKENGDIL